jgi:hypothetical protein
LRLQERYGKSRTSPVRKPSINRLIRRAFEGLTHRLACHQEFASTKGAGRICSRWPRVSTRRTRSVLREQVAHFNDGQREGAGFFQSTIDRRRRASTATARSRAAIFLLADISAATASSTGPTFSSLACCTFSYTGRDCNGAHPHPFSRFSVGTVHIRPAARGYVRIQRADPMAPPAIAFKFSRTARWVFRDTRPRAT